MDFIQKEKEKDEEEKNDDNDNLVNILTNLEIQIKQEIENKQRCRSSTLNKTEELMEIAHQGNLEKMEKILQEKVNLNHRDKIGFTSNKKAFILFFLKIIIISITLGRNFRKYELCY